MSTRLNKKRVTTLLYEWLAISISKALVENDQKKANTALKIVKRYFKKDTQLYKELRLAKSLLETNVSTTTVAASILNEAKIAARNVDVEKLDHEKSCLIKAINYQLNDPMFYDQHVQSYKNHATVHMLFNEWRDKNPDIAILAEYEDKLVTKLSSAQVIKENSVSSSANVETDELSNGEVRLLMSAMTKKLNEKYAGKFSDKQRNILKIYAFSKTKNDEDFLKRKLLETRDNVIKSIDERLINESDYIKNKLTEVKTKLLSEQCDHVNDDVVSRFMLYVQLDEELQTNE